MMNTTIETTDEITTEAIRVLFREMGVAKTLRFLSQLNLGLGDYTNERREANDNRTVADIVTEIKKRREQSINESLEVQQ